MTAGAFWLTLGSFGLPLLPAAMLLVARAATGPHPASAKVA